MESQLITPFVMAKTAEVHPFFTIFSLVLFGGLFGFLGILLALPLVLLVGAWLLGLAARSIRAGRGDERVSGEPGWEEVADAALAWAEAHAPSS